MSLYSELACKFSSLTMIYLWEFLCNRSIIAPSYMYHYSFIGTELLILIFALRMSRKKYRPQTVVCECSQIFSRCSENLDTQERCEYPSLPKEDFLIFFFQLGSYNLCEFVCFDFSQEVLACKSTQK